MVPRKLQDMRMTRTSSTTIHNNGVTINKPISSILMMTLLLIISHASTGFIAYSTRRSIAMRRNKTQQQQSYHHRQGKLKTKQTFLMSNIEEEENSSNNNNNKKRKKKADGAVNDNDNNNNNDGAAAVPTTTTSMLVADVRGRPAGVVIDDLNWRVEKLRLEEANKRRFLKSGPRFLPYDECRKWVQAWGERWISSEEWNDWIESGEKRNSYIPSRPDEYYTRTGRWISWEHFLGVKTTDDDVKSD